jgi:ribosomal protein L11 methylase PrmA
MGMSDPSRRAAPFIEHLGSRALAPRARAYETLHICVARGALPGAESRFADRMLAMWFEDGVTTLVFETPQETAVRAFILDNCPGAEFLWEGKMPYGNWEAGAPVRATHLAGFAICPPWDMCAPQPCETRIIMDAGLAFGSGLHPATHISLALLRPAMERARPRRVLDLGCGTGILSMAALLLGAERATAVDYSLLAVNAARINAHLNGLQDRMRIIHEDLFGHLAYEADLVLCNMNFPLFDRLLTDPDFLSHERILLCGVNPETMHREVCAKLTDAGREITAMQTRRGWYGYLTERKP